MAKVKTKIYDKRYNYFITNKTNRQRIMNKGIATILDHLGEDALHKLNTINNDFYNTGEEPEAYDRNYVDGGRGSILQQSYYKVNVQGSGANQTATVTFGYAANTKIKGYNTEFGPNLFKTYKTKGHTKRKHWSQHTGGYDIPFEAYVDFIENGGEGWIDTTIFPKKRMAQLKNQATHASDEVKEWYESARQDQVIMQQLSMLTKNTLTYGIDSSRR